MKIKNFDTGEYEDFPDHLIRPMRVHPTSQVPLPDPKSILHPSNQPKPYVSRSVTMPEPQVLLSPAQQQAIRELHSPVKPTTEQKAGCAGVAAAILIMLAVLWAIAWIVSEVHR